MSRNQNIAADPKASAFLTANAGSGKTSTLVNRVARLLLGGAKPEHILCVTYTKAAAAEMQGRLFETLGNWAVLEDHKLTEELVKIDEGGRDLPRARALFARALETPGGLKIQTIHAFCEKLLRRFPLEASLSPAFQVQDDLTGHRLSEAARDQLLLLADFPDIAAARDRLICRLGVMGFSALLGRFASGHDAVRAAVDNLLADDDWQGALFRSLGLDGVCTSHDCLTAYAETLEWRIVRDIGEVLLTTGTSKTNLAAGQAFIDLHLHFEAHGIFALDIVRPVFFTREGASKKTIYTKETAPADARWLDAMATEIGALIEQVKAADIAADTLDAIQTFQAFSAIYGAEKAAEGALDFQDLINRAKGLLSDELKAAWVLYKLDGGLEHILVDEAQDTSEDQWAIVRALSGDFFSGHGQSSRIRTVFAVGDEKQSIYGFQGARPDRFLDERQYFESRAREAGMPFVAPDLTENWRSLPQVLGFVDAAFNGPELAYALNFTGEVVGHQARRDDASACVELWPLVQPIAAPELSADDDDIAAVDQPSRHQPSKRLARQIAATVAAEIAAGRAVYDKLHKRWRTVHAGDVLILVRQRGHLFEHIIRELKMAGVAVSGADRLKLGDHIAFQDLRALLRFCLQPADDLSLACILRSPLCDLDETALYALAQPREGSLWQALVHHPQGDDAIAEAREFLLWAQRTARNLTAFDFLARVLNRRDRSGYGFRQRFLTRLGDECEDVLDETLALALTAEGAGLSGLSACLELFEFRATDIKREQEEGAGAVRVMTVHGSKGLEAPWVILPIGPDHGTKSDGPLVLSDDGALYLCVGGKGAEVPVISAIREARALKDDQEALRLFYVACTRARDRLTICGYAGARAARNGRFPGWHDLAADAFTRLAVAEEVMTLTAPFDDADMAREARVLVHGRRSPAMAAEAALASDAPPLPAFATAAIAQADVDYERWQAISQMGDEDRDAAELSPSPLELRSGLGRYRRGNLIHKLFEILPEVAVESRAGVAARYLGRQPDLDDGQRAEMQAAVMAVLGDARFAEAFGPQSRPEVAVAGQIGHDSRGQSLLLSGRIDRLVMTDTRVLVIDYKSNRPAPDRAEDAAIAYQRQMAGYVALLRQIHPQKSVEAALLWTDGPKLTPLSDALVNLRLDEILSR